MVSLLPFGGALARCVLGVEVVEVGEDSHARDTLISKLFSVFYIQRKPAILLRNWTFFYVDCDDVDVDKMRTVKKGAVNCNFQFGRWQPAELVI